jgi:protein-tyrosine phosphatase
MAMDDPDQPVIVRPYVPTIATKLMDGLFVGSIEAAQDAVFMRNNKITRVLNCVGAQVPNIMSRFGVKYLTIRHIDATASNVFDRAGKKMHKLFRFIDTGRLRGGSVLVHDIDGNAVSCCVAAAYLMQKFDWGVDKALQYIQFKRPDCQPAASMIHQLRSAAMAMNIGVKDSRIDINDPHAIELLWLCETGSREEDLVRNTFLNSLYINVTDGGGQQTGSTETKRNRLRWSDHCTCHTLNSSSNPQHRSSFSASAEFAFGAGMHGPRGDSTDSLHLPAGSIYSCCHMRSQSNPDVSQSAPDFRSILKRAREQAASESVATEQHQGGDASEPEVQVTITEAEEDAPQPLVQTTYTDGGGGGGSGGDDVHFQQNSIMDGTTASAVQCATSQVSELNLPPPTELPTQAVAHLSPRRRRYSNTEHPSPRRTRPASYVDQPEMEIATASVRRHSGTGSIPDEERVLDDCAEKHGDDSTTAPLEIKNHGTSPQLHPFPDPTTQLEEAICADGGSSAETMTVADDVIREAWVGNSGSKETPTDTNTPSLFDLQHPHSNGITEDSDTHSVQVSDISDDTPAATHQVNSSSSLRPRSQRIGSGRRRPSSGSRPYSHTNSRYNSSPLTKHDEPTLAVSVHSAIMDASKLNDVAPMTYASHGAFRGHSIRMNPEESPNRHRGMAGNGRHHVSAESRYANRRPSSSSGPGTTNKKTRRSSSARRRPKSSSGATSRRGSDVFERLAGAHTRSTKSKRVYRPNSSSSVSASPTTSSSSSSSAGASSSSTSASTVSASRHTSTSRIDTGLINNVQNTSSAFESVMSKYSSASLMVTNSVGSSPSLSKQFGSQFNAAVLSAAYDVPPPANAMPAMLSKQGRRTDAFAALHSSSRRGSTRSSRK